MGRLDGVIDLGIDPRRRRAGAVFLDSGMTSADGSLITLRIMS
jgi:hypothetical protein